MDSGILYLLVGALSLSASPSMAAAPDWPALTPGASVVVVTSSDHAAYKRMAAALDKSLRARHRGVNARIHPASEVRGSALAGAHLVVALGAKAVEAVLAIDGDAPVAVAFAGQPKLDGVHRKWRGPVAVMSRTPTPKEKIALLHRIAPDIKALGVLVGSDVPESLLHEYRRQAAAAGLRVFFARPTGAQDVHAKIQALLPNVEALVAEPEAKLWDAASIRAVVIASLKAKIPLIGFSKTFAKAGAVASIYCDDIELIAGDLANLILARPKEGTTHTPSKTLIALNLVVADRIGLRPSPDFVESAKEVFR